MKSRNLHTILLGMLFCLAGVTPVYASAPYNLSDSGNAEYAKGNYAAAIAFYTKFLSIGYRSADVYYNLGNCYYRTNSIGKAILNYERAKKLAPGDADIRFNLQLANQRTSDKIVANPQLIFITWWNNFANRTSERGWGIACIILFIISLTLILFYLMSSRLKLRQLGFWSGIFMLALCLFSFLLANQQYNRAARHNTAIVMSASVTVKGAPSDSGTQLFLIHEGAKVWILKTNGSWVEIKLANGNQGWMPAADITII